MEIWKYVLNTVDIQLIEIPKGGKILALQNQNYSPCIWVLVNPKAEKEEVTFETFGTGHEIEDNYKGQYVGTYQQREGLLVFHVFVTKDSLNG